MTSEEYPFARGGIQATVVRGRSANQLIFTIGRTVPRHDVGYHPGDWSQNCAMGRVLSFTDTREKIRTTILTMKPVCKQALVATAGHADAAAHTSIEMQLHRNVDSILPLRPWELCSTVFPCIEQPWVREIFVQYYQQILFLAALRRGSVLTKVVICELSSALFNCSRVTQTAPRSIMEDGMCMIWIKYSDTRI